MKTKHLLGFLLILAVACKSEHAVRKAPVGGGSGGVMVGGENNGDAGGPPLAGGTDVPLPAGGTGGSTGGPAGAVGTNSTGGRSTTGGIADVGGNAGATGVGTGGALASAGQTGGAAGTGAAVSTGGTEDVCATVDACVGDAVGAWTVTSSCLRSSGRSNISDYGLPCTTAVITGTVSVTGGLTLGADGRYTDQTVNTGSETWALGKECLERWATMVNCEHIGALIRSLLSQSYESFQCGDAASGGGCTCQGKINQIGGIGVLYNDVNPTGPYTLTGGTLVLGDVLTYSSCAVNAGKLTVSPKPALGARPYTGRIVFSKTAD